jgi:putative transcriptional regulator
MAIRWKLHAKLTEHGLTPYRLADVTGLSIPTCYDLVKDGAVRAVKASTLSTLCSLFQCEPGDLLEYTPD